MEPTRLSPGTRRTLQVVSVVMIVGGLAMAVTGFVSFANSPTDFDAGPPIGSILLFLGGPLVAGVGIALAKFAFLRFVADVVVTETEGAMEHGSRVGGRGFGRGIKESGVLAGPHTVKVRCRACGALDSEDAKFCSGCGQPM